MSKKLTKEDYRWNRIVLLPFLAAYIPIFVIAIYAPQWYWIYVGILFIVVMGSMLLHIQREKELQKT